MADSDVGPDFNIYEELGLIGAHQVLSGSIGPSGKPYRAKKRAGTRGEVKTAPPTGPVVGRYDPRLSEELGDLIG